MLKKPMLAETVPDNHTLRYPLYASYKLDGIRATVQRNPHTGYLNYYSRSLKMLPNEYLQWAVPEQLNYFDGELIIGEPTAKNVFNKTTSGIMTIKDEPKYTFYVFDKLPLTTESYDTRLSNLIDYFNRSPELSYVKLVEQFLITNEDELNLLEGSALNQGYEGLMLRSIEGKYKMGRSTLKQGYLLKVKRFIDAEAVVIGYTSFKHNANNAFINELGYTTRSKEKDNMVALDMLGSIEVRDIKSGIEFSIGTGFSTSQREFIWGRKDTFLNRIVKYKHFPIGAKDKPRMPVFLGFRDPMDMD